MMAYYVVLLAILALIPLDLFQVPLWWRYMLSGVVAVVMILVAGTRFQTGADWPEYTYLSETVAHLPTLIENPSLLWSYRMEPGYVLFNSVVVSLGGSVNEIFFIAAVFTVGMFVVLTKRYTVLPFIALLLYLRYGYMLFNMMFVRQGIAVAIFFYALKYLQRRECYKYMLLSLAAAMFHNSLYLALPLYFFVHRRFNNIILIAAVVISLALSQLSFASVLMSHGLFDGMSGISDSVIGYINNSEKEGSSGFAVVEKLMLFVLFLVSRHRIEERYSSFNILFNLFVLSVVFYFSFMDVYVLQQRLTVMFQLSTVFILAQWLSVIPSVMRYAVVGVLILFVSYFYIRYVSGEELVHYQSWMFT